MKNIELLVNFWGLYSVQIELEKKSFTICDLLSIFYFMKNIELLVNFWSLFCRIL